MITLICLLIGLGLAATIADIAEQDRLGTVARRIARRRRRALTWRAIDAARRARPITPDPNTVRGVSVAPFVSPPRS
jgi:hypothetical protein